MRPPWSQGKETIDRSGAIGTARQHQRVGELDEAKRIYYQLLERDGRDVEVLQSLAFIFNRTGECDQALAIITRAEVIDPQRADTLLLLGEIHRSFGNFDKAEAAYRKAIDKNPRYFEAYNDLGIALVSQGRLQEAEANFKAALLHNPHYYDAQVNLGNVHQDLGLPESAIASYQRAIDLEPDRGLTYVMLGRALQLNGRPDEALARFQEALVIDPELAEGYIHLGHMLHEQGMLDDALECFNKAVALEPENVNARWSLVMSQLALVHDASAGVERSRSSFRDALDSLDKWLIEGRVLEGANAVGLQQPFYIAYHESDNLELLSRYGDLCSRLTRYWQEREGIRLSPPHQGERIRIGIVSGQIRNHSVWNAIIKGWLQHVDQGRFEFHVFYTGGTRDQETEFAQVRASYFAQGPKSMRGWVDAIVGQRLDVLVYPEVGMDPPTVKLASMRLAPVQAGAWGHPETSGLPTLDYYLSAQDFEPPDAQRYYREQLVALPNLGCCYEPLPTKEVKFDLDEFGIDSEVPIFVCAGTPFKYLPHYDDILVKIADRLQRCQFVFFNHMKENLSARLEQRLEESFEKTGLYFSNYGVFLPWLNRDAFYSLLRRADVYLDTVGFSGFNTAMQAIECALPVVTLDGRFMRGRLASGILKRMGLEELIATSEERYIDLAASLAMDSTYNLRIRDRIIGQRGVLFGDLAPIRAFENFIIDVSQSQHAHI